MSQKCKTKFVWGHINRYQQHKSDKTELVQNTDNAFKLGLFGGIKAEKNQGQKHLGSVLKYLVY